MKYFAQVIMINKNKLFSVDLLTPLLNMQLYTVQRFYTFLKCITFSRVKLFFDNVIVKIICVISRKKML